jgi:PPE-repeat protein
MDFGALSPEINSGRIYAGPGSAPMMAAASAWDGLAAELRSAASVYHAVITRLTSEEWMGPASGAMAAAAAPYVTWMSTTAEQAEQTAAQAKAAAAAYEEAFATTVPPAGVTANRTHLQSLVATNVLGQNTPAIAATEAHYGEMWGQDAAAMYGYAANSSAASRVTPFAAPQQNTNPAGQDNQAAAAAQANGTSAGSGTQSTLSEFLSSIPDTLHELGSPLVDESAPLFGDPGDTLTNGMTNLMSSSLGPMGLGGIGEFGAGIAIMRGAALAAGDPLGLGALDSATGMMPGVGAGLMSAASSGPAGMAAAAPAQLGGAVTAGVGRGSLVGALSVPQSWAAATPVPAAPPAAGSASLVSSWSAAAPAAERGGMPGVPGMPMSGSGAGRGFGFAAPRYGFKPTVMARPVVAG